ncbi:hypothetical protein COO60DRAFT_1474529, partial [Scenedesmus sp. NREL 46B-D3]
MNGNNEQAKQGLHPNPHASISIAIMRTGSASLLSCLAVRWLPVCDVLGVVLMQCAGSDQLPGGGRSRREARGVRPNNGCMEPHPAADYCCCCCLSQPLTQRFSASVCCPWTSAIKLRTLHAFPGTVNHPLVACLKNASAVLTPQVAIRSMSFLLSSPWKSRWWWKVVSQPCTRSTAKDFRRVRCATPAHVSPLAPYMAGLRSPARRMMQQGPYNSFCQRAEVQQRPQLTVLNTLLEEHQLQVFSARQQRARLAASTGPRCKQPTDALPKPFSHNSRPSNTEGAMKSSFRRGSNRPGPNICCAAVAAMLQPSRSRLVRWLLA